MHQLRRYERLQLSEESRMKVSTVADQLFFVTVHLTAWTASGEQWVGTGSIYVVQTDQGPAHFLVTNRHVFERATRLQVAMIG